MHLLHPISEVNLTPLPPTTRSRHAGFAAVGETHHLAFGFEDVHAVMQPTPSAGTRGSPARSASPQTSPRRDLVEAEAVVPAGPQRAGTSPMRDGGALGRATTMSAL